MSQPIPALLRHPLLVTIALLAVSLPASAITIAISGSFTDPTANDVTLPDSFSISNDSGTDITQIVVNLSTAVNASFDMAPPPNGFFTVVLPDDTGFTTQLPAYTSTLLTMNFGPGTFTAGEVFDFTIDVDDGNQRVDGNNIAGATVTAYFSGYASTPLIATMVDGGGFDATWTASAVVPEPATLSMLSLGLLGLAWNGQRAGRRRRRQS